MARDGFAALLGRLLLTGRHPGAPCSPHDLILRRVARYLFITTVIELLIIGAIALLGIDAADILLGGLLTQLGNSIGALGTLLVKGGSEGPQEVVAPPNKPLEVTETST